MLFSLAWITASEFLSASISFVVFGYFGWSDDDPSFDWFSFSFESEAALDAEVTSASLAALVAACCSMTSIFF